MIHKNRAMDVLLLNQYFTSNKKAPEKILGLMPLNLLYLASYLQLKKIPSKIYELGALRDQDIREENGRVRCGLSDAEITEIIKCERPKIIGLGCMYSRHYIDVISIARLIKRIDPSIITIIGGNHATALSDMVLKEPSFDFVVRGEGEVTFYELCKAILSETKDFRDINGIAYCDAKGNIVKTEKRELVKNLDDLTIDYTLINLAEYTNREHKSPFLMRYPAISIISTRGCPGKCVYGIL